MAWVDPRAVDAMRARLRPAFAALGRGAPGTLDVMLSAEGVAWCTDGPTTLADAPHALEHGRDLEARLSFASGPRGVRTGEVLGMHTVADLSDLVAAERYQLAQFDGIKACPAWAAADPGGYGSWAADYFDAAAKLSKAIESAQSVVDLIPQAVQSVTPLVASDAWDDVIAAAHPLVELAARFIKAGFCPFPSMAGMPQPKAADLDLSAYKWSDAAAKSIEKTAAAVASTGGGIVIGVVIAVGLFAFVKIVK